MIIAKNTLTTLQGNFFVFLTVLTPSTEIF